MNSEPVTFDGLNSETVSFDSTNNEQTVSLYFVNSEPVSLYFVTSEPVSLHPVNSEPVPLDPQTVNIQFLLTSWTKVPWLCQNCEPSTPWILNQLHERWNSFSWPRELWTGDLLNSEPVTWTLKQFLLALQTMNNQFLLTSWTLTQCLGRLLNSEPVSLETVKLLTLTQFCFLCLSDDPGGSGSKASPKTKRQSTGRLRCLYFIFAYGWHQISSKNIYPVIREKFYSYCTMLFDRNYLLKKIFRLFS